MAILSSLGIEWQQLLAQVVNFAIIASLLTFFLYRPVLRMLDERRARIRTSMEQADRIAKQSKEFEVIRLEKLKAIDQEAAELFASAKRDIEVTRAQLLATAQRDAAALKTKAERDIADERDGLHRAFQEQAVKLITKLSSKVLQREFTPADQDRIVSALEKDIATELKA